MSEALRFCLLAVIITLILVGCCWTPLLVLDEEGYWAIAEVLSPLRPYDWSLRWPPFDEEGAFIYAHPPGFLWWTWALRQLVGTAAVAKLISTLLWVTVLSVTAAQLVRLRSDRPWLALCCWWGCAAALLPMARGLMPDLPAVALGTLSMLLWFRGEGRRAQFVAGLVLGCAAWVKYPVLLLVLVPVVCADRRARWFPYLLGFLLVIGLGELWLWLSYGQVHLWVVLRRASEIASGSLGQRGAGMLMRASLALTPLVLLSCALRGQIWSALVGAVLALFWGYELGASPLWGVGVLGGLGGACFVSVFGRIRQRDPMLTWVLLVVFGMLITHNYAAPRYLALAILPWSIWISNNTGSRPWLLAPVGVVVALLIGRLEVATAEAHSELSEHILVAYPDGGSFSGEWTFRAVMQTGDWRLVRSAAEVPAPLVIATESVGGAPPMGWSSVKVLSADVSWLQLVNRDQSAGYYAETLGFWPLGVGAHPLARLEVWEP